MPKTPPAYRLTADLVAAHSGASGIVAIAAGSEGRVYDLHAERPGAHLNESARAALVRLRSETVYGPQGIVTATPEPPKTDVLLVSIDGPIEERAGYHDPCGGWTDGHDAIYERLAAAFEIGDVVLCAHSPGGACSGGPQAMRRAAEMKAKHGRRCIGHVSLGASMCMWWLAAVCDEIYVDDDGVAGSIGVRGMHASIAGALAKEGVVPTFAAWPDEGKLAGVPELPLSDVARTRMDRDVSTIGEAFAAAVAACPTAKRAGLTRDAIVALGADALTGQAAVNAGLADGVATLEDVIGMALATAGTGNGAPMDDKEKDDKPKGEDMPEDKDEGEETPKDEEGEDGPPQSKKEPHNEEGAKSAAIVPPAKRTGTTALDVLGISAKASLPAQKAQAAAIRQVYDFAASLTGQTSPDAIVGGLNAIATDAANGVRYRGERDTLRKQIKDVQANAKRAQETTERADLAKRLVACNVDGWSRGNVYVDQMVDGKRVATLAPVVADMKIGTLRGLVQGFEKTAPKRDPFQPDRAKAEAVEQGAKPAPAATGGEPTEAQIVAAMQNEAVKQIAARGSHDLRTVAIEFVKTTTNARRVA